jgi:hypothetical protein
MGYSKARLQFSVDPRPSGTKTGKRVFLPTHEIGGGTALSDPHKLRELAAWYRLFAEKAANPVIWEARLHTAEDLDREADSIERRHVAPAPQQQLEAAD